jgi:hypothetical protein
MGFGNKSKTLPEFSRLLRSIGLSWTYFFREKDDNEIFPWENMSTGVDKSWLLEQWGKIKEAAKGPIDQEGFIYEPCYVKCTACGVCVSKERKKDNFWPAEIYGENRRLPVFQWGDHEADKIDVHTALDGYTKQQQLRTLRVKIDINPAYRYINPSKLKFRLRRAFFRVGAPILNQILSASDKILEKAWFAGDDVYEVYLADKMWDYNLDKLVTDLNAELSDEAFTIQRIEKYSGEIKKLRDNFEYVLYSLTLNKEDYSISIVRDEIKLFDSAKQYDVKVKVKSKTQRDVVRVETLNGKEFVYKLFARDNGDETFTIFVALSDNMAIYDFSAALLKTSKRNLYRFPSVVEEYMLRNVGGATLDMFASDCIECGSEIEENIFGEAISDELCLHCKYMKLGSHRKDTKVAAGLGDIEEDQEGDSVNIGGHDDDDLPEDPHTEVDENGNKCNWDD